jgi:hypothetical protein
LSARPGSPCRCAFLAIAVVACPAAALAQPVQWTLSSGGDGNYYEIVVQSSPISWTTARDAAESRTFMDHTGVLASAFYQRKDLFIRQLALSTPGAFPPVSGGNSGPWLGGIQLPGSPEPAGGFTWINGDPWSYTNWFRGEPNNGAGDVPHEEAVQLFYQGAMDVSNVQWNDLSSGDDTFWPVHAYVVEYRIPAPSGAAPLALGAIVCAVRRMRRRRR